MKAITKAEFFDRFIEISENLTITELRMLYLIMTRAEVTELTQEEFAKHLKTHRRTINIGLNKLKQYGYVSNIRSKEVVISAVDSIKMNYVHIPYYKKKQALNLIIDSFIGFYKPREIIGAKTIFAYMRNACIIVNEDFYNTIIGNTSLCKELRYDNEFITKVIREQYPESKFYFDIDISSHESEKHYQITRKINSEIKTARPSKTYHIKKDKLLDSLNKNYSITEEEVINVIKVDFPRISIEKNRINFPKPW